MRSKAIRWWFIKCWSDISNGELICSNRSQNYRPLFVESFKLASQTGKSLRNVFNCTP